MFNAYGPTEATIWATGTALSPGQPVSIGAPIPGVRALVLDARLNPAPVGVVGELYLAGPAIAHGYLGRPELTAERFVANPYGPPGTRMYRSGDLVRWSTTGTLHYHGRTDTQIKIRGQRLELGEIENTLLACPQVTRAAAAVHHSDTGNDHLIAYVALEHSSTADHDAEVVDQWQQVYDELYDAEVEVSEFGSDFRGWNSSYTGEPIPLPQMQQWRSAAVDQILALQPRRVLEIGVGSGLLLAHVAPECDEYWGTDFSAPTIQTLQTAVAGQSWGDRVRLQVQPADVADGLPQGHFDVVVLNSVIQYFPSAGYLLDVLDHGDASCWHRAGRCSSAMRATTACRAPSRPALRWLGPAPALTPTISASGFSTQCWGNPNCFWPQSFSPTGPPNIPPWPALHIELKRGEADNELTRYRYDVIVHKSPTSVCSLAGAPSWAWTDFAGLSGLHTELTTQRPAAVRVTAIPHAGVIADVHIEQALAAGLPVAEALADADPAATFDSATAEQLHRIGEAAGYHVAVTWGAQPGTLDAVFIIATDVGHALALTDVYLSSTAACQRSSYANDPHTNSKISAVRQWLGARLPEYMVPAQIVVLEEFPLTSSGKIDRKALPEPVFAATSFRAPQTQTEKTVAEVFAEVLGLGRVGVDDDFFALGGDSLIAIRVCARLQSALGRDVPVRYLFDASTAGDLAAYLDRHQAEAARPLSQVMARPPRIPLSYAQQRLWFLDQLHGPSPVYNLAVALRLRGRLDADALGQALVDVVGRHESLRTVFAAVEGVPEQLVVGVEQADLGWRVVDAASWSADRLEEAVGAAARHPFDLANESPLHTTLFHLDEDEHVLVAVVHHIAADGWSIAPLMRDVGVAYAAAVRAEPPIGPISLCSMSITRCGSARSWVISTTATAASPRSWGIGSRRWPGCPSGWCCPPIGPIRRLPITAAPVWRWTGRPNCSSRLRGWPASTTRPVSW